MYFMFIIEVVVCCSVELDRIILMHIILCGTFHVNMQCLEQIKTQKLDNELNLAK